MTLLIPIGLLALLILPIIVLLHLIRDRQRRYAVPSLQHWLRLPRPQEGQRIRSLPLTLLLLLHLLVAALLAFALARPQLGGTLLGSARQLALVIDTSTSMSAAHGSSTRFAEALAQAQALLDDLRPNDQIVLVAAGPEARTIGSGGVEDRAVLREALAQLQPAGDGSDLSGALTLAHAALDTQHERRIVVLSDQAVQAPSRIGGVPVSWQQIGESQPNRAIVTFSARAWGERQQIYARIINYADQPFQTRLRLYGDDQLIETRTLQLRANGENEQIWTLPNNYRLLRLALDGNDALPDDDQSFLALTPPPPANVLLVSSKPDALRRALTAARANVTVLDPIGYEQLVAPSFDVIVFDSYLPIAWPDTAVWVINPPRATNLLTVTGDPSLLLPGELIQNGAILDGLSFGGVRFGTVQPLEVPSWAVTQLAIDDQPLIVRGNDGSREIAIWTFDLASGNMPSRLAFPLLTARTIRDLMPDPLPSVMSVGSSIPLQQSPQAAQFAVTGPDGSQTSLDQANFTQPGFYAVVGPKWNQQIGVSAGSQLESDLRSVAQSSPSVPSDWAAAEDATSQQRHARDIWPWLALAALAILMLEWGYVHR
jgi:Ca-activated chloride channel family protein